MITESKINSLNESGLMDLVVTYQLLKLFALPFSKWKACEAGIIDAKGVLLRDATPTERHTIWRRFEIMVWNLLKIITKFTGHSQLSSALVALYLFREGSPKNVSEAIISHVFGKDSLNTINSISESEMNANFPIIEKDLIK
jgi:hypothetical protein